MFFYYQNVNKAHKFKKIYVELKSSIGGYNANSGNLSIYMFTHFPHHSDEILTQEDMPTLSLSLIFQVTWPSQYGTGIILLGITVSDVSNNLNVILIYWHCSLPASTDFMST
jgi:hypothetical protein